MEDKDWIKLSENCPWKDDVFFDCKVQQQENNYEHVFNECSSEGCAVYHFVKQIIGNTK